MSPSVQTLFSLAAMLLTIALLSTLTGVLAKDVPRRRAKRDRGRCGEGEIGRFSGWPALQRLLTARASPHRRHLDAIADNDARCPKFAPVGQDLGDDVFRLGEKPMIISGDDTRCEGAQEDLSCEYADPRCCSGAEEFCSRGVVSATCAWGFGGYTAWGRWVPKETYVRAWSLTLGRSRPCLKDAGDR